MPTMTELRSGPAGVSALFFLMATASLIHLLQQKWNNLFYCIK